MSANYYMGDGEWSPGGGDCDKCNKDFSECKCLGEFKPGYHVEQIARGKFGELSKIQEELDEAKDAEQQGVKIMLLNELADMVGAIEGYLANHFPDTTMNDLKEMSNVTRRAFESGARTPRD